MRLAVLCFMLSAALPARLARAQNVPDSLRPPPVDREFRAVWVATVRNMDWPSRPGMTTEEQQQELLSILDRVAGLNMNAVVLQVRTEGDALYASRFEPWSRYLTGEQGKKPDPLWDPLEFAVAEAHKRGLELHAWFNPYRAAFRRDEPTASSHVSKRRRDLVVPYGQYLWMDPGKAEVRQLMLRAVMDVVRRYDIDAVHIDDYFYPYPESRDGRRIPFPDSRTYATYRRSGGTLDLASWRRRNVDGLIDEFYTSVKRAKPWVKVGISPFGIWRPGYPATTTAGLDQYDDLYADARKWLRDGMLDYIAPQLYWPTRPPEQSYPVLLKWWSDENVKGRHVWPGLALYKIPLTTRSRMAADEITEQVEITRDTPGATGHVHFNARVLIDNVDGIADKLATTYARPALVPASPWLERLPPRQPVASVTRDSGAPGLDVPGSGDALLVRFAPREGARHNIRWWVIQARVGSNWSTTILPGGERRYLLREAQSAADVVSVIAVDRSGNASVPVVIRPR